MATSQALKNAIKNGHIEVVKILLDAGESYSTINKNENARITKMLFGEAQYDLFTASIAGEEEIVKFFIKYNMDVNSKTGTEEKESALHLAVRSKHVNITKILVVNGADVNAISDAGVTPLMLASINGASEIVDYLLENNADITLKDSNGYSAISYAVTNGDISIIKKLLFSGAKINEEPLVGIAAQKTNKEVLEFLLDMEAPFDISDKENVGFITSTLFGDSCTNLNEAIDVQNIEAIKFIEKHSVVSATFHPYETPLYYAVSNNKTQSANYFISKDDDVTIIDDSKQTLLHIAAKNDNVVLVHELMRHGVSPESMNENNVRPVDIAAYSNANQTLEILKNENSFFKKGIKTIEFQDYKSIVLEINSMEINQLGALLSYETNSTENIDWLNKENEVKKALGLQNLKLIDNYDGNYLVQVYSSSNEAKLVNNLMISSKKPVFEKIIEYENTTFILFKKIPGVGYEDWIQQEQYIEDILEIPIDIQEYDNTHSLWPQFGKEQMVLLKESNISVLPQILNISGKYLKTEVEDGFTVFYFTSINDSEHWRLLQEQISHIIGKRIEVIEDSVGIKLKECIEEAIPKLLELKDSHKNYPKLHTVKEDGQNKTYYYTFLPEMDLNTWKEKSKKINFRTLFNEPNKVYKLDIYDKTNEDLYDKEFSTQQFIVLHEFAKIPSKEDLSDVNIIQELFENEIFWGYASGSKKYHTKINLLSHMMIIGASGSGKSNFINGVILSLLNSAQHIKKIYLIDLKSGIEFNRYKELESEKIDVFSRGTKPSKLLSALYEVEAEMYLREEYMVSIGEAKLENEPIFVIIDEFAQIGLMHARGEEQRAKDEIYDTLIRIGTRARSANIKLIVQTQDPKSVGEDLKVHLMSRALLKTAKEMDSEFTLQNPETLDELGIKHTKFDKGRYVFEDYNDGDTLLTEVQFPFIDPKLQLHKKYKKQAQTPTQQDDNIFDSYKEYVKNEYDYLAKTKVLASEVEAECTAEMIKETEEEEIQKEVAVGAIDFDTDFDFDALLLSDEEQEDIEDEFSEINQLFSDSQKILRELQEKAE